MKRSQQFYIFKLSSGRIRKVKYQIELDLTQARKNAELISISRNQVIDAVLKINGKEFNQELLDDLFVQKRAIKREKSSPEYISQLLDISNKIDDILFVPDIISVSVDNKKQYESIITNGFSVNGVKFTRLLCGSGHSRRNTPIFCSNNIEKPLKEILNNGRKISKMVLAKNNAYFALSYSGNLSVSEPYFCVVPDYEVKRKEIVEFIEDNNEIKEKEIELDFNLFDGQGLISPRMSQQWAKDLEIEDYIPSSYIIRNSFLKGMVCTFDFHKYSENAGKHIIKDIWGNDVNLRDMDLILTGSQFKAWNQYDSINDYIENCRKNNFNFGVVRVAPKQDYNHVFTNYQFLQVLNLKAEQIENLCKKTIEYFSNVINKDFRYSLLYLMGKMADIEFDNHIYDKINDNVTKALILNNDLIDDVYIKNYLYHSLNKKIKESYTGKLIVDGNYSFIVQDPVAFIEYILGLPVNGLLKRGKYYSGFWNKKGAKKIASMRSPLTWRSEINVLNLVDTKETEEWYKYLNNSVIIHNVHSCDMLVYADADADGDLVMTTDQKEFIDNNYGGLPIHYNHLSADKCDVIEDELWEIDKISFDSKIGYITNCLTTLYSMQVKYFPDSPQYIEIEKRLKLCRKQQGNQIDLAKGVSVEPFPSHWTRWTKLKDNLSEKETEKINLYNSVVIDKRPYFFKYLYTDYNKQYKNYNNAYDNYCITNLGKSLVDVLNSPQTDAEKITRNKYYKYSPLLDSDCAMNNICHYMENNLQQVRHDMSKGKTNSTTEILKSHNIEIDNDKLEKLDALYKKYKTGKRNFANIRNVDGDETFKTLEQYNKYIRQESLEISNNIQELANLAIIICYERHPSDSKNFAWNIFGEGIIRNVEENRQDECYIPSIDSDGNIEYLGSHYTMKKVDPFFEDGDSDNDYL